MDAEDDEALAEPSPPLQQLSDAPIIASQCDTDIGDHVTTGKPSESKKLSHLITLSRKVGPAGSNCSGIQDMFMLLSSLRSLLRPPPPSQQQPRMMAGPKLTLQENCSSTSSEA